ncbi:hypothetical protein Pint_16778 [Pistacia integerrima]|uniref:Uncharacterized protein n=1 Tax=Pistacia integerrima TaxID=434235 RepID=A0ACC0ZC67_9ROSI|nr:hypothetical protein Pint_16778 [Pistacia integerrima]
MNLTKGRGVIILKLEENFEVRKIRGRRKQKKSREKPKPSLFPLFPTTASTSTSVSQSLNTQNDEASQWLCNASFNTDLSVINDAVLLSSSTYQRDDDDDDDGKDDVLRPPQSPSPSYELLEEEEETDRESSRKKKRGRSERRRARDLKREEEEIFIRWMYHAISFIILGNYLVQKDFTCETEVSHEGSGVDSSILEESWEDEVLRKTREFNKLTREHPYDEKGWLAFADFQDTVASKQPQKGARIQILEKKISILEKAVELNPDNEELLLSLMKSYQRRDNTDVLIGRWEKVLMQHSGNYKLWREFLHVVRGEFSRFKVSDMRKMYAHAIQAIAAACTKQFRQVQQVVKPSSSDPAIVQLELSLVDIFLSLCRLEWQAGYQELATALFQAEIEFSLFCPSLLLTEQSKHRLFEHFWNSDGSRVGEEGALGWSMWLEKEEENRQKVMNEEFSLHDDDQGGWTGWSEPVSKQNESSRNPEDVLNDKVAAEEFDEEADDEGINQEDDTEALLKLLGIDIDAGANAEVKDTSTWTRWAEEESSRDCNQWMPVRTKDGLFLPPYPFSLSTCLCFSSLFFCIRFLVDDGTPDGEADEQLLKVILYEDVREYLFSLSSEEARSYLVTKFIDFFGGKISQWTENHSDGLSLDILMSSTNDISRRTEMMKFLRNAILLCLTAFPRNYVLEEAALVAEELSVTKMNSCGSSVTPCRALAKGLLKSDRQDILLCGVYARKEALFGNIDHARRIFDMALSSIDGFPSDVQSNAPLLYLWYAEVELANNPGSDHESSFRAIHILSCLGSGLTYSPFKNRPSSLQLLRAHQGYMERMKTVRSGWARGAVNDQSIALICSAALFEELTNGLAAGINVLHQAFTMVLPELCCYPAQLPREHVNFNVMMKEEATVINLNIYLTLIPELFSTLVEISNLYTTPNKLRLIFDAHCHKKPSLVVWIFALAFEMSRGGTQHRIRGLFERALADEKVQCSVVLWRWYIAYEVHVVCNLSAARRIFFRAIHACPWSKKLWLDGFFKLRSILTAKELSDLQEVMRDKELNLRTDVYEILLQDA